MLLVSQSLPTTFSTLNSSVLTALMFTTVTMRTLAAEILVALCIQRVS